MSDVSSIASASVAVNQQQVAQEVAIKVLKMANEQQKSVLTLLDGVVQEAAEIQQSTADTYA
ncbi:MAG: hypothetical protein U1D55_16560 [Phycisphaerae bacterium]